MEIHEHIEWSKDRALAILEEKQMPMMAWIAFKHDMCKHDAIRSDKTYNFLFSIGDEACKFALQNPATANLLLSVRPFDIRKFIQDFN